MEKPQWLIWAQQLQALSQTGLTYARDEFDTQRYTAVRQIAAEMMAAALEPQDKPLDAHAIVGIFERDAGYATPKVDVRAAVFDHDRILLVREREDGCWALPGGWADIGDAPSLGAIREVREESGYHAEALKLAAVFDRDLHGHPPLAFYVYKLFFVCRLTGGEEAHSYETDGVGFFERENIPPLSLTRVTPAEIELMFEHYRHPDRPTSFD